MPITANESFLTSVTRQFASSDNIGLSQVLGWRI